MKTPLLSVNQLAVEFLTPQGRVAAVRDVSLEIGPGEIVGIVGESGSGKSVTALAVMGILPRTARVVGGCVRFRGSDLPHGKRIGRDRHGLAMIFQSPRSALNPIRPVGSQIVDALQVYTHLAAKSARTRAVELLEKVQIRDPKQRFWCYPFELSGGMCQRAMIAIALACEPDLLIADEPTTGLDVTTQKAILDLLVELAAASGMGTALITHDLALAAERCQRLVVLQGGRVVETGPAEAVLCQPTDAYTRSLVAATAGLASSSPTASIRLGSTSVRPLLEVKELSRVFRLRQPTFLRRTLDRLADGTDCTAHSVVRAVDGVNIRLMSGESLGLVGESGSGKSTLAGLIVRLIDPTSGGIQFLGEEIGGIPAGSFARRPERRKIQMVFQDPTSSLNPRQTAFDAVAEPFRRLGDLRGSGALRGAVNELAAMVGLSPLLLPRLPHQLSGGEKARVGIARAIALRPSLLVLDEPTASLDVGIQAVILDLLVELRRTLSMSYLFVSHDLTVVRRLCNRVIVMQTGRVVDEGPTEQLLTAPTHQYTRSLVAAIPRPPIRIVQSAANQITRFDYER
jgi:peptide/nickel transport system ATP-binding protein